MTAAVMDILWSRQPVVDDLATVHALVIGVSKYDHLPGGTGQQTTKALLAGLGQLSAAATSATRIANWLRDNFDYPKVQLGSVRLLASPSPAEVPLPGGANPPPATYEQVKKAVTRWRRDARATPGNITLLYRGRARDPDKQRGRHLAAAGCRASRFRAAGSSPRCGGDPAWHGGRSDRSGDLDAAGAVLLLRRLPGAAARRGAAIRS